MRLKLDENLPESLVSTLAALSHDVDNVRLEGFVGRPDPDVWQAAQMYQYQERTRFRFRTRLGELGKGNLEENEGTPSLRTPRSNHRLFAVKRYAD